ncbi:MAG TPA: hypothetical protein PKA82_01720 [Pyrinomonadaceae bacterium]|nr:hypothetical protein [Pyrinomonadaceae bacterium]
MSERKVNRQPWHGPPKFEHVGKTRFLITAACYEHKPWIGISSERMSLTAESLLSIADEFCSELYAWCILPNHYHLFVDSGDIRMFQSELGKFHGRSSFEWNKEDDQRGRKVWFRSFEKPIDSIRHFYVTLNYVHNNPVKHGLVEKWTDWPYSSAVDYLETVGRDEAKRIWLEYPVLGYGDSWDR